MSNSKGKQLKLKGIRLRKDSEDMKNLATGMKRIRDICAQERLRQENEDAYNEIRIQMHNRVIKKLRLLKEEWKLENISQVTERIMLAFFKNDI